MTNNEINLIKKAINKLDNAYIMTTIEEWYNHPSFKEVAEAYDILRAIHKTYIEIEIGQEKNLPNTKWQERIIIEGEEILGSEYFFITEQQAKENEKEIQIYDLDEEDCPIVSGWYIDNGYGLEKVESWQARIKVEEEAWIKSKGHDCYDFVCHGMYARENGSLNDYYYCEKCNDLLQTG